MELIVSAYLMKRGWTVFRAVSPSSPFDLVIYKDEMFLRVEVTKGTKNKNGSIGWTLHDPKKYDVLAVVLDDNDIYWTGLPA